jgi:hypothetical protein
MSTEEMSLEDWFCAIDDFCRLFLPDWRRQQLQHGERKRRRGCRLVVTAGNVDDRKPVPRWVKGLTGKLFGDRGSISQKLVETLLEQNLQLR